MWVNLTQIKGMEIRPIKAADNSAIAKIIREVFIELEVPKTGSTYEDPELDQMFETYSVPRAAYFVISCDGEVCGGGGIAPLKEGSATVCELQKMYFAPKARAKGFGRMLIKKCLDFAKAQEFQQCYIETMPKMLAAQKLYKKTGFSYINGPMGNTGHCSCQVWMLKDL